LVSTLKVNSVVLKLICR